jgi:hypothetical protein
VHCAFSALGPNFKSGDRQLGDATMDVNGEVWKFFDRFLKGKPEAFPPTTPSRPRPSPSRCASAPRAG